MSPPILQRLLLEVERARQDLGDSLTGQIGSNVRPPGRNPDGEKGFVRATKVEF